jgi:enoyl-CoA hydratase/carnithine racemase
VETIECTADNGVALVRLNRPEKRNAWNATMRQEFRSTMAELEIDTSVRSIVVTGAGQSFCVGADMEVLGDISDSGVMAAVENDQMSDNLFGTDLGTFGFLLRMSKPVIAAINGAAAGVGLILACFCDVRFAAEGCKFAVSMSRLGLPAEQGLSWILPRVIGVANAADLLLGGRVILAEEAKGMGLVNWLSPGEELLGVAMNYAQHIAREVSPASLQMMKSQLYGDLSKALAASVNVANEYMEPALKSADYREGVAAFKEHRSPRFET